MKRFASALALATVLALPSVSDARPLSLKVNLNSYGGRGAYLALYLVDAQGAYKGTLWMSGWSSGYYRHLRGWVRASRGNLSDIQGLTGASVGSGRTLDVTLDVADALLQAGYQVRVDAAVEGRGESPNEVVAPLGSNSSGKKFKGRRFIKNFVMSM